jgi:hypothetical protein
MNLTIVRLSLLGALLLLPSFGLAQTRTASSGQFFTPTAGAGEFTFGASGATNQDFDDSSGGLAASYGRYLSPSLAWALRQTVDYVNPDQGEDGWAASTRLAFDYHFARTDRLRPFVGISFGGIYGDSVEETWMAGLEAGVKYYVKAETFVFVMADYSWLFDDAKDVEDRFDDGAFFWNAGIGFNF